MSICLADIAFVMGLSCKTKYSDRTASRNEIGKTFMLVHIARSCKSYCKNLQNPLIIQGLFAAHLEGYISVCLADVVNVELHICNIFLSICRWIETGRNRPNSHTITWFVFCLTFWGTLQGRWETWGCGRKCSRIPFRNLRKSGSR